MPHNRTPITTKGVVEVEVPQTDFTSTNCEPKGSWAVPAIAIEFPVESSLTEALDNTRLGSADATSLTRSGTSRESELPLIAAVAAAYVKPEKLTPEDGAPGRRLTLLKT